MGHSRAGEVQSHHPELYYRTADAIVLVYDSGAAKSFKHLPEWLLEVEKYAGSNVIRMLIDNSLWW